MNISMNHQLDIVQNPVSRPKTLRTVFGGDTLSEVATGWLMGIPSIIDQPGVSSCWEPQLSSLHDSGCYTDSPTWRWILFGCHTVNTSLLIIINHHQSSLLTMVNHNNIQKTIIIWYHVTITISNDVVSWLSILLWYQQIIIQPPCGHHFTIIGCGSPASPNCSKAGGPAEGAEAACADLLQKMLASLGDGRPAGMLVGIRGIIMNYPKIHGLYRKGRAGPILWCFFLLLIRELYLTKIWMIWV